MLVALLAALGATASTTLAQSKGKRPAKAPAKKAPAKAPAPTPAPAKGSAAEPEIEMNPDDAGAKKGSGAGSDVNPDEIDMGEPENKQGDLKADLTIADQGNGPVAATPIKKTPLSWQDIVVVIRKPFLKV
ncbi:MAG TPA: hypothetical protein VK607_05505, partial [Kofleriaceae bacterium]|nr:hypothetical protein [Kofleriaceae bacterium]